MRADTPPKFKGHNFLFLRRCRMSGQAGMRGYLVQTIVCLLDALEELNWSTVTLEPNEASEKVDILWRYADGRTKAVQVKSSRKQIREGQVNAVA
jgi:hypothetical protein